MKKLLIAVALLATGCVATHPDSIKPASVSVAGYAALDCSALHAEDQRAANALLRSEIEQKHQRTGDMVGIAMVGISPTGLGQPQAATDIARLKGEREAIASTKSSKGCTQPPATVDEMAIRRQMTKERLASSAG